MFQTTRPSSNSRASSVPRSNASKASGDNRGRNRPGSIGEISTSCGIYQAPRLADPRVDPVGYLVEHLLALGLVQQLVVEAVVALEDLVARRSAFVHHLAARDRCDAVAGAVHHQHGQLE